MKPSAEELLEKEALDAESFDWAGEEKDALISMNKGLLALLRAERYAVLIRSNALNAVLAIPEMKIPPGAIHYAVGTVGGFNQALAVVREAIAMEMR